MPLCHFLTALVSLSSKVETPNQSGSQPNFAADAARLYITQRGDIDKYFALPKLSAGSSNSNSAVAMKADHCRIIGRDSVRIYAGGGNWSGYGWHGELNSVGGDLFEQGVIELMAGTQEPKDLQPAVLGHNLRGALIQVHRLIKTNHGAIETLYRMIGKVWLALAAKHPELLLFGPAFDQFAKSLCGSYDSIMSQFNTIATEINYLGMGYAEVGPTLPGKHDILSTSIFLS